MMPRWFLASTMVEKTVYVSGVILLCLTLYTDFIDLYVGDKIWLLYATNKLLTGKKLYVDIFEVNPPLIYWIYSLPVGLSIRFPLLKDYNFLCLFGVATAAFSIFISSMLLRNNPQFVSDAKKQWEFILLLSTAFISLTSTVYFFDREYIFLILIFPYIMRWLPSISGAKVSRVLAVIIGIMAGAGFCIKPHCAIVFLCIQMVVCWRERSLAILVSIENILIYVVGLFYLLAVYFLTPDYIHVIIPMALATYAEINRRVEGMLDFLIAVFYFGITFADFRLKYQSPYRKDIYYFCAICPGFIGYALLNNGWGYTWNPLITLITIITGFVLWEHIYLEKTRAESGESGKQFIFGIRACLINFAVRTVVVLITLYFVFIKACGNYMECPEGKKFVHDITAINEGKPLASFGTLSIDAGVWPYLSRETGAAWVTRYNHIWMLPAFFAHGAEFAHKYQWILDSVSEGYAQDMRRDRPQLIFVDDEDQFFSVHKYVDLVGFMNMQPAFRSEWRYYRYAGKIDSVTGPNPQKRHTGYYVYKRID